MDEFIRLESPVGCLGRTATRDVELGGVTIRQGQQLLIRFDSANRDDNKFPEGEACIFSRANAVLADMGAASVDWRLP